MASSSYETASWVSRATWAWMSPLIQLGHRAALQTSEVPALAAGHRPEVMAELFSSKWPASADGNPVRQTLLKCFWKHLVFNAVLAFLRVLAMYTGPLLIQAFVKFASAPNRPPLWEGVRLVLALLLAKLLEALLLHQFFFQSQKLGMKIRGALIPTIFRKSLRLSCSARQKHGVGMIVNHVVVDTQQLSSLMELIHDLWMMPLEVALALGLMFRYMGTPAAPVLVSVAAALTFVIISIRSKNRFQSAMMKESDQRMKSTNEMLKHMLMIKLQAWETHFQGRIERLRCLELGWLRRFIHSRYFTFIVVWSAPIILTALLLGTCALCRVHLDAGTVFTATALIQILQEPMRSFPQALIQVSQALISLRRLDVFLTSEELDNDAVLRESAASFSSEIAIEVKDGLFTWDANVEGQEVLRGIDLDIRAGTMAAVVGVVGSGKSSLLSCILGEMRKLSGMAIVRGTMAYVPQTAWILTGSIEENILFGKPMDRERYNDVIRVCCLEKDLELMENGDQTEIGERGVNLSGGQNQRIQLARAVYQDCEIYILDDVFSAIDAQTASKIFKECIRGALKNKTIVLVTNQVDFLHDADMIFVMKGGMIVQSGTYNELLQQDSDFAVLVTAYDSSMEHVESSPLVEQNREDIVPLSCHPSTSGTTSNDDSATMMEPKACHPSTSGTTSNDDIATMMEPKAEEKSGQLIKDEQRGRGHVSLNIYKKYITEAWGWWGPSFALLLSLAWQGLIVTSDYWLAQKISGKKVISFWMFMKVYGSMAAASVFVLFARSFLTASMGIKTANSFFKQNLNSISHAPMSFLDSTPSGRILVRASSDQKDVDMNLAWFVWYSIPLYINVIITLIVMCLVAWPSAFTIIPMVATNFWYMRYYLPTSRELTRLESITSAPLIHLFSESINGIMVIRAFRKEDSFCQKNINQVNTCFRMNFHGTSAKAWFGFRLEVIGSSILCLTALLLVLLPRSFVKTEFVGLSLSYGMSFSSLLFVVMWVTSLIENKMISAERLIQFMNIPSEAKWRIQDCIPNASWPTKGEIDIIDLKFRYQSNTPLALKGITISIHGGEKVGVVGRTGSGKSTLIKALFRIVEPSDGKIMIDGIDISNLGLHDLRCQFSIIPQDPVLFEGTIRTNIDPLHQYSDSDIWQALDCCQLRAAVASNPKRLDAPVFEDGENWSVGQRQLLCLGRVILKRGRILFMDEATASVDSQTDVLIQNIIRENFTDWTIISIAHRIPSVMHCDRVLVMDEGLNKEFDKPADLMEMPSLFRGLVEEYARRGHGEEAKK